MRGLPPRKPLRFGRTSSLSRTCNVVRALTYSFWGGIFDSISMSRSSLDSKTSRHSIHSTYSASSSRETTWTRGCRHGWSMDLLGGKFGVLSPGWLRFMSFALTARALVRFSGILDRNQQLSSFSSRRNVKSRMHHRRLILGSATFRDCIRGLASVCHRVSKHTKAAPNGAKELSPAL